MPKSGKTSMTKEAVKGRSRYERLKELARQHDVYERAKEMKVKSLQAEGKSREEITATPRMEDLTAALEEAGVEATERANYADKTENPSKYAPDSASEYPKSSIFGYTF